MESTLLNSQAISTPKHYYHHHHQHHTKKPDMGKNSEVMPTDEQVKLTLDPYIYLTNETKGKEIRSRLIDAFNLWFNIPQEKINVVKSIVRKLHNASLLIDDIEDNSKLRRGKPCAHMIFGVPATINSANYVYFEALKDCQQLNNHGAIDVYMNELLLLHIGQGMDIYWRDNMICPKEEEYLDMVKNKTGGLFRLSVGLIQALSENKTNFTELVNYLAIFFQILDDYQNLQSPMYHHNKSYCEDLTEGKFSFPIIHSIHSNPSDKRLINILRQKPTDNSIKQFAVEVMKETKSFEYCISKLKEVEAKIYGEIERCGGNEPLVKIVKALSQSMSL